GSFARVARGGGDDRRPGGDRWPPGSPLHDHFRDCHRHRRQHPGV
ncbi:MAG: hypothetical protein AVDCRST_MAG19-4698, partial [uncultured Thermomicrobiales bacterium]